MKRSDPFNTVRPEDMPAINNEILARRHVAVPSKNVKEFISDRSNDSSWAGIGMPEPGDPTVNVPSPVTKQPTRSDYIDEQIARMRKK